MAYTAIVRPILEYACPLWSQSNKKILVKVENIQRKSTKYILDDYIMDYKERLQSCGLLPLSYRREFLELIFCYNCCHSLIDCDMYKLFGISSDNNSVFSNIDLKLQVQGGKTEKFMNCFVIRIANLWNNIPEDLKNTELTEWGKNSAFKRLLKEYFTEKLNNSFINNVYCSWISNCRCAQCRLI
jgi:hypothetical protein